ncbi:hypothetical protein JCM5350_004980 [Sporobolomyces pararoseus]
MSSNFGPNKTSPSLNASPPAQTHSQDSLSLLSSTSPRSKTSPSSDSEWETESGSEGNVETDSSAEGDSEEDESKKNGSEEEGDWWADFKVGTQGETGKKRKKGKKVKKARPSVFDGWPSSDSDGKGGSKFPPDEDTYENLIKRNEAARLTLKARLAANPILPLPPQTFDGSVVDRSKTHGFTATPSY